MNPLSPLGWLYGAGAWSRNALYDHGLLGSYPLGAKTISVGNITTGGTGKTPLVAHIAEILAERGEKVCILTRGYGRENPKTRVIVSDWSGVLAGPAEGGDEPVELARKLLGKAVVVADADRVAAGRWAKDVVGITAFVLDDGFQHRRAKRDLDIVCIDATDPFGGGAILPAGRLREPAASLGRADAFVITRADLGRNIDAVIDEIRLVNARAPVFIASAALTGFADISHFVVGGRPPYDRQSRIGPAYGFCGLANPDAFFETLRKNGVDLRGVRSLGDHHAYTQSEIEQLEHEAEWSGARCLVTTGKDAVKLAKMKFEMKCYVAEAEVSLNDPSAFNDLILSV